MFSILHCADLHLEASFAASQLPAAVGRERRLGLREALVRILALAREKQVDAVTVAGDLYEQVYATPDTAEFLRQQFADLAPIRVYIAPGESDPYTEDSLYALTHWPENVSVCSAGQMSPVELAPGIRLWGAACPPEPGYNTLDGIRGDRTGINLLLLHAASARQASPEDRKLFWLDELALRDAGFDVALLGHHHNGQISQEGGVQCVYPGSPEPLAPVEADGDHHVVLLSIEDGAFAPERIPVDQWRYIVLRVDLSGCSSPEEAAALVTVSLRSAPGGGVDERTICRVTLIGARQFESDLDEIRTRVDTPAHVRYESALRSTAYDLEQLAYEPTARGLLVRHLQDQMASAADDTARSTAMNALTFALKALEGKRVRLNEIV